MQSLYIVYFVDSAPVLYYNVNLYTVSYNTAGKIDSRVGV